MHSRLLLFSFSNSQEDLSEEKVMSKIKVPLTAAFLMCGGLNEMMIGGFCLLYVMKNDSAQAQGAAYSKSEQRAPAYTAQELALARQTLADGLRKLYESNQGGGFTCYESNQDGFTCMKRA
jgi:hypothetical protein